MMTATAVLDLPISVQEYLESEKKSDIKHEYYFGQLIEMAGEKKKANRIARNILRKIELPLLEQGLDTYFHDIKAAVDPQNIYRYPDLMVAPLNEEDDIEEDEYFVFEPVLIVEVASEDSLSRDQGKKRREYTALPSLQYYLIVYQEEMFVEMYVREDRKWSVETFEYPTDVLHFEKFGLEISLKEVYERVSIL